MSTRTGSKLVDRAGLLRSDIDCFEPAFSSAFTLCTGGFRESIVRRGIAAEGRNGFIRCLLVYIHFASCVTSDARETFPLSGCLTCFSIPDHCAVPVCQAESPIVVSSCTDGSLRVLVISLAVSL